MVEQITDDWGQESIKLTRAEAKDTLHNLVEYYEPISMVKSIMLKGYEGIGLTLEDIQYIETHLGEFSNIDLEHILHFVGDETKDYYIPEEANEDK